MEMGFAEGIDLSRIKCHRVHQTEKPFSPGELVSIAWRSVVNPGTETLPCAIPFSLRGDLKCVCVEGGIQSEILHSLEQPRMYSAQQCNSPPQWNCPVPHRQKASSSGKVAVLPRPPHPAWPHHFDGSRESRTALQRLLSSAFLVYIAQITSRPSRVPDCFRFTLRILWRSLALLSLMLTYLFICKKKKRGREAEKHALQKKIMDINNIFLVQQDFNPEAL